MRALHTLGEVLDARGVSSRVLIAGGSSLLLLGFVDRPTADVDVIGFALDDHYIKAESIPPELAAAVHDVAMALDLPNSWINNGPASLFDFGLPEGFEQRVTVQHFGPLEVHVVGRLDLIHFKLYAAVDQSGSRLNKHLSDLVRLGPSVDELVAAAAWTRTHDPSDGFEHELRATLSRLGVGDPDV